CLAGRGVYLRNSQIVERMSAVTRIVLDKTGTLTAPASGATTWSGAPLTEHERSWLRSLTGHSSHPLPVRIAESTGPAEVHAVHSFREIAGRGIEGRVDGRALRMGSATWVRGRQERDATERSDESAQTPGAGTEQDRPGISGEAASRVLVAIDGRYRGSFGFESVLRPEVDALIRRLRGDYQLILLSGDQAREAERFRRLLGEQARLEFNQRPFDKLDFIRELQAVASGGKVMMVGDGLNDAGALQQADVGVAVVEKVGTFSPASDVILDAAQLARLAEVLV